MPQLSDCLHTHQHSNSFPGGSTSCVIILAYLERPTISSSYMERVKPLALTLQRHYPISRKG